MKQYIERVERLTQIKFGQPITKIYDIMDFIDAMRSNLYQQYTDASIRSSESLNRIKVNVEDGLMVFLKVQHLVVSDERYAGLSLVFRKAIDDYMAFYGSRKMSLVISNFVSLFLHQLIEFQRLNNDFTFSDLIIHFSLQKEHMCK